MTTAAQIDLLTASRRWSSAHRIKAPWRPIATAPRDGSEFLGAWMERGGWWNVDFFAWSEDCQDFTTRCGSLVYGLVAWTERPELPGRPRRTPRSSDFPVAPACHPERRITPPRQPVAPTPVQGAQAR